MGYKENVFFHASTPTNLVVDHIGSWTLGLNHFVNLLQINSFRSGVGLSANYILPGATAGYSSKAGYSTDLQMYLNYQAKNLALRSAIYYGQTKQDSDFVTQKEMHVGMLMGITWVIDEE